MKLPLFQKFIIFNCSTGISKIYIIRWFMCIQIEHNNLLSFCTKY